MNRPITSEWPSADHPQWARLGLTHTGDHLHVAVTYGVGSDTPTVIGVALDPHAIRDLAHLANVVREVLDAGGDPPVDA